jgi:hypothetical protein
MACLAGNSRSEPVFKTLEERKWLAHFNFGGHVSHNFKRDVRLIGGLERVQTLEVKFMCWCIQVRGPNISLCRLKETTDDGYCESEIGNRNSAAWE